MHPLLQKLSGGDRRSIGRVAEVVAEVHRSPDLFGVLFEGMLAEDALIRMRAADAAEKLSASRPELLAPHRDLLLGSVARCPQQEVRWHVAQMMPRLAWTPEEREFWMEILLDYLEDESKIVKTSAMQALADLACQNPDLLPRVVPLLRDLTAGGSPAMRSRGRRLLQGLGQK
jgi:HEAT repeat protein